MSGKNQIQVGIKVRPLLQPKEREILWKVIGDSIQLMDAQSEYYFDHIFDESATNQLVFDKMVKQIVQSAVEGFNGTIFAYGQTSSGKTYTMMGDKENPGVMVLAVKEIFKQIANQSERKFLLRIGYMEIYNEKINDLLNKTNQDLKIHETNMGYVSVNCEEVIVTSEEDMLRYLEQGGKERTVGETNMNERSSRSHAIFRIIIESQKLESGDEDCITQSILNLVDLAGSERADQTKASGARLKEGGHINKSLLFLSNVIKRLSENEDDKYISFRDSKLTRILQASLGGNALTAIICTIKPNMLEETQSTLNFAMRAKTIKNKPQLNEIISDATMMKRLEREIENLKSKLEEEKRKNENQSKSKVGELEQRIKNGLLKIISCNSLDSLTNNQEKRRRTWASSESSGIPVLAHINRGVISQFQPPKSTTFFHCDTPLITLRPQLTQSNAHSTLSDVEEMSSLDNRLHNPLDEEFIPGEMLNLNGSIINSPAVTNQPEATQNGRVTSAKYINPEKALEIAERNLNELQTFTNLEQMTNVTYDINNALQQKVTCLTQRNMELENERLEYMKVNIELTENMKRLDQRRAESEKRATELQEKICEFNQISDKTEKKLIHYENELKRMKDIYEKLEIENRNLVNLDFQYKSLQNKAKIREQELLERISDKDQEVLKLEKTLKSLRRHNEVQLEEITLTQSVSCNDHQLQHQADVAALQEEIQNLKLKLEETVEQKSIIELEGKRYISKSIGVLESDSLDDKRGELLAQFDELQKEYDVLSNQLVDILQENDNFKLENAKLKENLENIIGNNDCSKKKNMDITLNELNFTSSNVQETEGIMVKQKDSTLLLKAFLQMFNTFDEIEVHLSNNCSRVYKLVNAQSIPLTSAILRLRIFINQNETDLRKISSLSEDNILNENDVDGVGIVNTSFVLLQGTLKTTVDIINMKKESTANEENLDTTRQQQQHIIHLREQVDQEKCRNKLLLESTERNIAEMREQISRLTAELFEKSLVLENCSCERYQRDNMLMTNMEEVKANTVEILTECINLSFQPNSNNIVSKHNNVKHENLQDIFILRGHETKNTAENLNNIKENLTHQLLDVKAQLKTCQEQLEIMKLKHSDICLELQFEKDQNHKTIARFDKNYEEWKKSKEFYENSIKELSGNLEITKQQNLECAQTLNKNEVELKKNKNEFEKIIQNLKESLKFEQNKNLEYNENLKKNLEEWAKSREDFENNVRELEDNLKCEKLQNMKITEHLKLQSEEWNKSKMCYESNITQLKEKLNNMQEKLLQSESLQNMYLNQELQQCNENFQKLQEQNCTLQNECFKYNEKCNRLENNIKELKEVENNLKKENEQVQILLKTLQNQIQHLMEEKKKLKIDVEESQKKFKNENEQLENDIKKLNECENLLKKENMQLQDDVKLSQEQMKLLLEEKKKLQIDVEDIQTKYNELKNIEKGLNSLKDENVHMKEEKSDLLKKLQESLLKLSISTNTIDELEKKEKKLKNEVNEYRTEYCQIKHKLEDAEKQIQELCKEDQARELLIKNLESKINDNEIIIQQNLDEKYKLEQQHSQMMTEKESNLKNVKAWKDKCEKLNNILNEKDKCISELQCAMNNYELEKKNFEKMVLELKTDRNLCENKQMCLEKDLQEAKVQLFEFKTEISKTQVLQSTLESLRVENAQLKESVESAKLEKTQYEEKLITLNKKLDEWQLKADESEWDNLKAALAFAQQQSEISQNEIIQLNNKLHTLESEIQHYKDIEINYNKKLIKIEDELQQKTMLHQKKQTELESFINKLTLNSISVQEKHNKVLHHIDFKDQEMMLEQQNHGKLQKNSSERKLRRLSTHDERRRQSCWGLTNDKETMTSPLDNNCKCEELDKKLRDCKQQLLIRDSQITWLNMELRNHPLKDENATLLKRLHDEQTEVIHLKQKLRDDCTKAERALSAYSKLKELLNKKQEEIEQKQRTGNNSDQITPKIVADAEVQTYGGDENVALLKRLQDEQAKVVHLKQKLLDESTRAEKALSSYSKIKELLNKKQEEIEQKQRTGNNSDEKTPKIVADAEVQTYGDDENVALLKRLQDEQAEVLHLKQKLRDESTRAEKALSSYSKIKELLNKKQEEIEAQRTGNNSDQITPKVVADAEVQTYSDDENVALLKRLQDEQAEVVYLKQKLRDESTRAEKALSSYSKIKELLNKKQEEIEQKQCTGNDSDQITPKIVANAEVQTCGDLNKDFHRLQLKYNDLRKLCRYRYSTILNLEKRLKDAGEAKENYDESNKQLLSPLQAAQFTTLKGNYDAVTNELKIVKEKYEKAKIALQSRRDEICQLRDQMDALTKKSQYHKH